MATVQDELTSNLQTFTHPGGKEGTPGASGEHAALFIERTSQLGRQLLHLVGKLDPFV